MKNISSPIHLSLTDDHFLMRSGLSTLLKTLGFTVDFETDNGDELINALHHAHRTPDICLLDINMDGMDGWETLREIRKRWPSQKVVFLTLHDKADTIKRAFDDGVNGYLAKNCTHELMKRTLAKVHRENRYIPEEYATLIHQPGKSIEISDREYEFLRHFSNDLPTEQIAKKMCVSVRTVDGYRADLMRKLDVKTKYGLISYAFRNGIASL